MSSITGITQQAANASDIRKKEAGRAERKESEKSVTKAGIAKQKNRPDARGQFSGA